MNNIYAVGSNDVLTLEIKKAMEQLLNGTIPVLPCSAEMLPQHMDGIMYICNRSMYSTVSKYTDPARIALLNLIPTSAFYLRIREIPYGSDIYIFNNKRQYCETLEELCRARGLNDYYYTALPYNEMPDQELRQKLASAKFIIGVEDVMNDMLRKPPYSVLLRRDVCLIGARRIASIQAANEVVTQLNRLLLTECQKKLARLSQEMEILQQENYLYEHYPKISATIEESILKLKNFREADQQQDNIIVRAAINQLNF